MFIRILIALSISSKLCASTFGVPDSDTAILIKLLGTEIQATAGILEILNISSKALENAQNMHTKIEDIHTKSIQLAYYTETLSNFPKTLERVKSMNSLHANLIRANNLKNDGLNLGLTRELLKENNEKTSKIIANNLTTNQKDKSMAFHYLKRAGQAKTTADGSIYAARSSALSAYKLTSLNQSIDLLNYQLLAQNNYLIQKEERKEYAKRLRNKRWGIKEFKK